MSSVIDTLITNRTTTTQLDTIREKIKLGTASASEKNTYLAGMISAYNADDLNRVGQAILYLKQELNDLPTELHDEYDDAIYDIASGLDYPISYYDLSISLPTSLYQVNYAYPVATAATKTDWAKGDIPRASELAYYLNNVRSIATAAGVSNLVPATLSGLTCEGANNIEKALVQAESFYQTYRQSKLNALEDAKENAIQQFKNIDSNWFMAGEAICGA
jgi:hypothetical protein